MIAELLSCYILLEVNGANGHLLDGHLLQLLGEVRFGIHILRRDRLVVWLLDSFLIRCAVFLRQCNVIGVIILLGSSNDIGLGDILDAFDLVKHILPGLPLRIDHHQQLGTFIDSLQLLLGFHHQLALDGLQLLIAEVAIHDVLHLFLDALLSRLHLTKQLGNQDHS